MTVAVEEAELCNKILKSRSFVGGLETEVFYKFVGIKVLYYGRESAHAVIDILATIKVLEIASNCVTEDGDGLLASWHAEDVLVEDLVQDGAHIVEGDEACFTKAIALSAP